MVICFHAGFGWMRGGYLGVSVFFTLSGFLITGLLLAEHDRTNRIDLGRFYGRRIARLAPAGLVCLGLVAAARALGAFRNVPHLGRDAVAALLQVFNWSKLAGSGSYADLFRGSAVHVTSPLEHYWSLAIEEQFYWLWPVLLWAMLRRTRRRGRAVVRSVAVVTAAFAIAAPVIATAYGADAAYWSTPARLAEILVGACLACWVRARPDVPRIVRVVGPISLVALVALAITLPSDSGPAYSGALPLVATASALVIWCLQGRGPLRRGLARGPLPVIGRVSYGLYLFHWPVDVLLRERGWNTSSIGGFAVALAITVVIALASYRLLEMPIRRGSWSPRWTLSAAAITTAIAVVAVVALLPGAEPIIHENTELLAAAAISPTGSVVPLATATSITSSATASPASSASVDTSTTSTLAARRTAVRGTTRLIPATTVAVATTTTFPTTVSLPALPTRPIRVLVVGDSTALYFAQGLATWSLTHPDYAQVSVRWSPGCGFVLDATITSFEAAPFVEQSKDVVERAMPEAIADLQPDIVVLMTTVNDVAAHEWSETEGPLDPTDLRFRARLASAYGAITDQVLALGVPRVAWVIPPTPTTMWLDDPAMEEPARWEVQHEVIRGIAGARPDTVGTIDLDAWFDAAGHSGDSAWRPDGVHMTDDSAAQAAELFAGPMVVRRALGLPTP